LRRSDCTGARLESKFVAGFEMIHSIIGEPPESEVRGIMIISLLAEALDGSQDFVGGFDPWE